jgi:hypothetical protein
MVNQKNHAYSPSPGVIYPTLSRLEDMGYTLHETENGAAESGGGEAFWPPIARESTRFSPD